MQRIFYFSGYRMTVFDWDGKQLFGSRDFQPDDEGFADFEKLLRSSVKFPARLLVDMIEEDFRRETIPHVNFFDRRDLLQRQLERHYRDEDYTYARLVGRTNVGRRDDQVLLSALTNTGLLAPWLGRLEEHEVQLMGIWSLPMLAEKLVRPMHIKAEHSLIVSRQVRSALRNCYIQKGKLLISRQAKFDRDMWDKEDFLGVISNLKRSTSELHTFLLNQRMLTVEEKLSVHVLIQRDQAKAAAELCEDTDAISYQFVELEDMFSHFGLQGCEGQGADALYAYLCSRKHPLYDHYAKDEQKARYHRHLMDSVVQNVTEFGSLLLLTAAVMLALKGMELDMQQEKVAMDIVMLNESNEARFGPIRQELAGAPHIRDSVAMVDRIQADAAHAPHVYFTPLARVLGQDDYRPIQVLQLQWQKYDAIEAYSIIKENRLRLQAHDPNPYDTYDPVEEQLYAQIDTLPRRSILELTGRIDTSGLTYRETIETMNRFVAELAAQDEIDEVILVKTAADVREASRFTDQITGAPTSTVASNDFEIVIMVGAEEEQTELEDSV